ncbi:MAG: ribosome biogenesis GTPase Der, partial [Anaerolineales bacterium]|nr:ribosome biogenesis GTPase Der [Anaerolineales bacterium]
VERVVENRLEMTKPIVAIVGRPNVGKSTLFNRLIEERLAIVSETAGTTRDRLYGEVEFAGREFIVVDTGGLALDDRADLPGTPAAMLAGVRAQAQIAMDEADTIVFITDVEQGATPGDFEIARILRQTDKPVYLVVNKADNDTRAQDAVEFFKLGLGDPIPISALHGVGVGDLLDAIIAHLPPETTEPPSNIPHLAIVGRPNVGKSSLLNAILGEERAMVSDIPGTTRDALDTELVWDGQQVVLIDTAGLRKRGHIEQGVEKYSTLRALRAIQRADVALLVIDADAGVLAQDQHVASYILAEGKGVVIVVNKWDLIEKDEHTLDEFTEKIRSALDFIAYAPVVFVSAKTHQRVRQVIERALIVREAFRLRVQTSELNEMLREATRKHAPTSKGKRMLKFLYATQVEGSPPTFVFFVNDKRLVHFTYERFLENQIRARWSFEGAPLRMIFRNRRDEK